MSTQVRQEWLIRATRCGSSNSSTWSTNGLDRDSMSESELQLLNITANTKGHLAWKPTPTFSLYQMDACFQRKWSLIKKSKWNLWTSNSSRKENSLCTQHLSHMSKAESKMQNFLSRRLSSWDKKNQTSKLSEHSSLFVQWCQILPIQQI
jgi:hypothetical protein